MSLCHIPLSGQVPKANLDTRVGNEAPSHDVRSGMCVFGGKALKVAMTGAKLQDTVERKANRSPFPFWSRH